MVSLPRTGSDVHQTRDRIVALVSIYHWPPVFDSKRTRVLILASPFPHKGESLRLCATSPSPPPFPVSFASLSLSTPGSRLTAYLTVLTASGHHGLQASALDQHSAAVYGSESDARSPLNRMAWQHGLNCLPPPRLYPSPPTRPQPGAPSPFDVVHGSFSGQCSKDEG